MISAQCAKKERNGAGNTALSAQCAKRNCQRLSRQSFSRSSDAESADTVTRAGVMTNRSEMEDYMNYEQEIELYGADAADWLKRWDEGKTVWSIEMGGLGPGYEQCIHITAAEILRHLLDRKYDPATWEDKDTWKRDRDEIEEYGYSNERINKLGLSGAQWGAALNLSAMFYRNGPIAVMKDERVKDRHIQVSSTFPV